MAELEKDDFPLLMMIENPPVARSFAPLPPSLQLFDVSHLGKIGGI
jgi:hypothetical protein